MWCLLEFDAGLIPVLWEMADPVPCCRPCSLVGMVAWHCSGWFVVLVAGECCPLVTLSPLGLSAPQVTVAHLGEHSPG